MRVRVCWPAPDGRETLCGDERPFSFTAKDNEVTCEQCKRAWTAEESDARRRSRAASAGA